MSIIKNVTRLGVVLTTLGIVALAFAGRASAALAMVPRSGGGAEGNGHVPVTPPAVHTVVVGGMPGWQIAAIAVVAALTAATAAVLLDRTRAVRRRLPVTAA
jgi:hypothetical protein